VIYPLLSRHAARGDRAQVGVDLTLGLRLVWFTALPAGIGIILVATPLTRLLFQHGQFTADDTARAAHMIACYATGVWAYCAIPVLVRGYYAIGERITPAKIGLLAMGLNLLLNLTLIWPLAEIGLAIATSIAAGVQVVLLAIGFSRTASPLAWNDLARAVSKSAVAAAAMSLAVFAMKSIVFAEPAATRLQQAIALSLTIGVAAAVYAAVARALGMEELKILFSRPEPQS
jgi:putative peptidoglycan lipid II flippase